jgi:hypothetical protein
MTCDARKQFSYRLVSRTTRVHAQQQVACHCSCELQDICSLYGPIQAQIAHLADSCQQLQLGASCLADVDAEMLSHTDEGDDKQDDVVAQQAIQTTVQIRSSNSASGKRAADEQRSRPPNDTGTWPRCTGSLSRFGSVSPLGMDPIISAEHMPGLIETKSILSYLGQQERLQPPGACTTASGQPALRSATSWASRLMSHHCVPGSSLRSRVTGEVEALEPQPSITPIAQARDVEDVRMFNTEVLSMPSQSVFESDLPAVSLDDAAHQTGALRDLQTISPPRAIHGTAQGAHSQADQSMTTKRARPHRPPRDLLGACAYKAPPPALQNRAIAAAGKSSNHLAHQAAPGSASARPVQAVQHR